MGDATLLPVLLFSSFGLASLHVPVGLASFLGRLFGVWQGCIVVWVLMSIIIVIIRIVVIVTRIAIGRSVGNATIIVDGCRVCCDGVGL